ncbi:MAG: alpha/beta hydrolase [Novosphingobium sp.]
MPKHLSAQAAAQLSMGTMANPPWPALDDLDGWKALISAMDKQGLAGLTMMSQHIKASVKEIDAGGTRVFEITPEIVSEADNSIYFELHGGALLWGGGESCLAMGKISAEMLGARVWAVDYRMPPSHPFPAPLDDCIAAYRYLLTQNDAANVIIGGPSAGGNLAAATVLRARDEGLAMPAACVLMTPEVDLTEDGDTFRTLLGIDTALTSSLMPANLLYAGGHDLADPYVSPVFGDFSKGFPPTFLQSGTRDVFLSNTVRMHRALRQAKVEADLHVFDAATHVMFMNGPEADDRTRELRAFVNRHWKR